MASVALLVGGAILNAAAFTGGNYLGKYLSGDSDAPEKAIAKKKRHDLALEKFQKDVEKYREEIEQYQDFLRHRSEEKTKALYGLKQTDKNFALYAKFHNKTFQKPRWEKFYYWEFRGLLSSKVLSFVTFRKSFKNPTNMYVA